ncbi:MAG: DUF1080 domain-containing protein [Planctomycetia bacterium]|nr:DUF1080 domain-containing protein [Planctomycetia bacterium]
MDRFAFCRRFALARCAAWGLALWGTAALAAPPAADPFDGRSLAGWMAADGSEGTAGWEITDGVFHLRSDAVRKENGAKAGHLVTRETFGDFQLAFEWKVAPGGNSGIKYRVRRYGTRWLGCEYQIYDDVGARVIPDRNRSGALYDLFEPAADKVLHPAGEWNSARILVKSGHVEHWLNGQRIVSADVGNPEWERRIAESKFNDVPDFARNTRGRFMLTSHGSEVWYRNFRFEPFGE